MKIQKQTLLLMNSICETRESANGFLSSPPFPDSPLPLPGPHKG